MPKPIIHGRDHAPGGADPIPFSAGGLTVEAQSIGAHSTNIAAGATANLEWGIDFGGDELVAFDGLGSATAPVFLQDGFYILNVTVTGSSISDGKGFTGYVQWSQAGYQYFQGIGISGVSQIRTGRTVAANGSATFPIHVAVHNLDSSARDFELAAVNVWRLT